MKATIEIDLQPFSIPNFVRPSENPDVTRDQLAIPLSSLDSLTLSRMCDEFRRAVFNKAGKEELPIESPRCGKCRQHL